MELAQDTEALNRAQEWFVPPFPFHFPLFLILFYSPGTILGCGVDILPDGETAAERGKQNDSSQCWQLTEKSIS